MMFWGLQFSRPPQLCFALLGFLLFAGTGSAQTTPVGTTYREAYDFGYADGRAAGQEDKAHHRLFDLANKKAFQGAEHGYDAGRHDRDVYLVAYRRGFEDGYEEGYELVSAPSRPTARATSSPPPTVSAKTSPPLSSRSARHGRDRIPAGTRVRIELLDTLSTKYNKRGDPFRARVIEDIRIEQETLVPGGAEILGSISYLKRAGRIRGRAQINLRFEELQLRNGQSIPLEATVVSIEKQSKEKIKGNEGVVVARGGKSRDTKRVGTSSAIGALIGVITGGKKGAGVGAAIGAAAGMANVLITRGPDAQLEYGTRMTVKLTEEVKIPPPTP
ncbi:MAG: hypothetical protein ACE5JX_17860 [Acidobacteriota bacterium]